MLVLTVQVSIVSNSDIQSSLIRIFFGRGSDVLLILLYCFVGVGSPTRSGRGGGGLHGLGWVWLVGYSARGDSDRCILSLSLTITKQQRGARGLALHPSHYIVLHCTGIFVVLTYTMVYPSSNY